MRLFILSAALISLAACSGGDGMTPEERAARDAKCAVIDKIVAASGDTPAFSSLTDADIPTGAEACRLVPQIDPAEGWLTQSETLNEAAYICTYETSPSLDPHSEVRVEFTSLGRRVTDCFSDWHKRGIGGTSQDGTIYSSAYQYSKRRDKGHPNPDGGYFAPVSYAWYLIADSEHPVAGQRIVFYVLAK